jgi:hypothetical protein
MNSDSFCRIEMADCNSVNNWMMENRKQSWNIESWRRNVALNMMNQKNSYKKKNPEIRGHGKIGALQMNSDQYHLNFFHVALGVSRSHLWDFWISRQQEQILSDFQRQEVQSY